MVRFVGDKSVGLNPEYNLWATTTPSPTCKSSRRDEEKKKKGKRKKLRQPEIGGGLVGRGRVKAMASKSAFFLPLIIYC